MLNSLRNRLILAFLLLIGFLVAAHITSFSLNSKRIDLQQLRTNISEIKNLVLKNYISYQEFYTHDANNSRLHSTKEQPSLGQHYNLSNQISQSIQKLQSNKVTQSSTVDEMLNKFEKDYQHHNNLFDSLVTAIETKSSINEKIEGEGSCTHRLLNDFHSWVNHEMVISLVHHEMNFILTKDSSYEHKIKEIVFGITSDIEKDPKIPTDIKDSLSTILETYSSSFNELVYYEREVIGTDMKSGLRAELHESFQTLDNTLTRIENEAIQQQEILIQNLDIWYKVFIIGAILIGIFVALYNSRRVSKTLGVLSDQMQEFAADDFKKVTIPEHKIRKGEVGVFVNQFQDFQKQVNETFEELRTANYKLASKQGNSDDSENRKEVIIDAIPDIMFLMDEKARYIDIHSSEDHRLTIPKSEIIGRHVSSILPPDVAQKNEEIIERVLKTGVHEKLEYSLNIEGKTEHYEARFIESIENQVLKIVRNITERKNVEKELQEYAHFFSVSMELMCIAGTDGYFKKLNPLFTKTLGYSLQELKEVPFYEFVHPDDLENTLLEVERLKEGEPTIDFTNRYRCKDGSYKWLIWTCSPDVETGLLYATARDITQLKEAEKALRKSEEHFRSLAENAPSFIARINSEHTLEYINRVERGYSMEDVIGTSVYYFINPDDHDRIRSKIVEVFSTGCSSGFETSLIDKNGDQAYFKTNLGPIKDSSGNVTSVILIMQDITEQVEANEGIKHSLRELQLIDKINNASIENRPLDELISMTMNSLAELSNIQGGRFYLYNSVKNELALKNELLEKTFVHKIQDKLGVKIKEIVPTIKEGNSFYTAIKSRSVIVAQTRKDIENVIAEHSEKKMYQKLAPWARKLIGIKTFMIVPLSSGDQIFGLITLYSDSILPSHDIDRVHRFMNGTTAALAKTKTKDSLIKSEASLKQAQQIAKLGSWEWDVPNNTVTWSDELYNIYQLSRSVNPLNYETFLRCVHPEDRQRVDRIVRQSFKSHQPYKFTHRLNKPKEEQEVYIEGRGNIVLNKEGEILGLYGTAMDITERVESEKIKERFTKKLEESVRKRTEELEISRNELKNLVDTMDEIALVSITNTNRVITYVNDRFAKVSGYSKSELVGQKHDFLRSDRYPESFHQSIWNHIASGQIWKGEISNKKKDGSIYWRNLTIVPYFDINKKISHYVAVSFDITEDRWMRKKLVQALQREKDLNQMKSRFVSTASHQFRTPMAIIQSNAELLSMIAEQNINGNGISKQLNKATNRINQEVSRMTTLMDEVLILGKISSGKVSVTKSKTDLDELILDICSQFDSIHSNLKRIEFSTTGKHQYARVDGQLFSHALTNLISNALKYSEKENPKIQIVYLTDSILIKIIDSGIGIPEKEIETLFEPFQRGSNVKELPGTGLGLTIAKEYVELNSGKLSVTSELGKGSTFLIELPVNPVT